MTVRDSFAEHFGEENAMRVEEASIGHIGDANKYGDAHTHDDWSTEPFRYHLMLCIGHDCFGQHSTFHGFTDMPVAEVKAWAVEHADLHEFDGDIPDFMALMAGAYMTWLNWERMGQEPPEGWRDHDERQARWASLTLDQRVEEMLALSEEGMRLLNLHDNDDERK